MRSQTPQRNGFTTITTSDILPLKKDQGKNFYFALPTVLVVDFVNLHRLDSALISQPGIQSELLDTIWMLCGASTRSLRSNQTGSRAGITKRDRELLADKTDLLACIRAGSICKSVCSFDIK